MFELTCKICGERKMAPLNQKLINNFVCSDCANKARQLIIDICNDHPYCKDCPYLYVDYCSVGRKVWIDNE